MKKYFIKPFGSFWINSKLSLKERWSLSLRDPAYLIITGLTILYIII